MTAKILIRILFFIGLVPQTGKAQYVNAAGNATMRSQDSVNIATLIKDIKGIYAKGENGAHRSLYESQKVIELSRLAKKLSAEGGKSKKYSALGHAYVGYFELLGELEDGDVGDGFPERVKKIIDFSKENRLYSLCGELYVLKGHYYSKRKGDFRSAIENNQNSIRYAVQSKDTIGLVNGYNALAMNYVELNIRDRAIEAFHKSLRLQKNPEQQYTTYVTIGDMYRHLGQYSKSVLSLQKAESVFKANSLDPIYGINLDLKYAAIYTEQKDYSNAARRIAHAERAGRLLGNSMFEGRIFYAWGQLYFRQEHYKPAIEEFKKSIDFQKKNKFFNRDIRLYNALGKSYYRLDSLSHAKGGRLKRRTPAGRDLLRLSKSCYLSSLALLPSTQIKESKKEVYRALKKIYLLEGDYKNAFGMLELEQAMTDSINNFETRAKFIERDLGYEFDRKREADSIASASERLMLQAKIGQKKAENRLLYLGLIAIGLVSGLVIVRFGHREKKRQLQLERQNTLLASKEKEMLRSELDFLKAQINPHFLFNVINAIYFKINKNDEAAREALLGFSDVLRYQLYECNQPKVSIEKEIRYLREYIRLQLLRNPNKTEVQLDISDSAAGFEISPFLLFPLVENAFKHQPNRNGTSNALTIRMDKRIENFIFSISNSYEPGLANEDGGIGLANVKRRLELLYEGKYTMDITKSLDAYSVVLTLNVE